MEKSKSLPEDEKSKIAVEQIKKFNKLVSVNKKLPEAIND